MLNKILIAFLSLAAVTTAVGQNTVMVNNSNSVITYPLNFWSANALQARTGLGLGSAATNPASAFQPAALTLSNLASNNAVNLTNLRATNIVGVIPSSNIPTLTLTNISGTLAISSGGTGSTNAADARTALGLGTAATNPASAFQPSSLVLSNLASSNGVNLTNINASNIVGTNFPAFLLRTNGNGAGLTNLTAANITGTVGLASNVSGVVAVTNGGTGATNAAAARTNLGATTVGDSLFTASNATAALSVLGISTNSSSNTVLTVSNIEILSFTEGSSLGFVVPSSGQTLLVAGTNVTTAVPAFFGWNGFSQTAFSAATARTNIGLPLPALTNTNNTNFLAAFFGANTNPVLVNTNGQVVSPTNFWQAAPIITTFIESQPTTNSSTNIAGSRFLHIHSLAPSIGGITNTIILSTNGTSFDGDIALVVHKGPTNSMTRVRAAGSTNNLITMTRFDEAIEFVFYEDTWQFNHHQAYTEPLYFAGTNAASNRAVSRTNLGLGIGQTVEFGEVQFFVSAAVDHTNYVKYNGGGIFSYTTDGGGIISKLVDFTSDPFDQNSQEAIFYAPIRFATNSDNLAGSQTNDPAAITRTNLGLGAGSTNLIGFGTVRIPSFGISFVEPVNEETVIFIPNDTDPVILNPIHWNDTNVRTSLGLGATNNVSFSNVTASGTLTATGTVTATTNLVVNGYVNFSTNHTNSNPATNNQIQKFLQIRIGTNAFFLPLYQ